MHPLAVAPDLPVLDTTALVRMIHGRTVRSYKQPIVNLREKRQIGYEALSRGIHPDKGDLIPADALFHSAQSNGLLPEIDRMCSDMAISMFAKHARSDYMLFVNFDVSSLEEGNDSNSRILSRTAAMGIPPESVAIEIVESKAANDFALMKFVEWHREFGFKIVLDDFGRAHSNLDRLHMLQPDIVKIDQHLVRGIAEDHYRRSIVESILALSEKVGAISLVEGAETIDDVLECVKLGANLFQGYYFSEPVRIEKDIDAEVDSRIDLVFRKSVKMLQKRWMSNAEERQRYEEMMTYFVDMIGRKGREGLDKALSEIVVDAVGVECAYIVDSEGVQITRTHFQSEDHVRFFKGGQGTSARGTNHFLKHYFLKMKTSGDHQTLTRPYVSTITGNMCRTMGQMLQSSDGKVFYLFVDFGV